MHSEFGNINKCWSLIGKNLKQLLDNTIIPNIRRIIRQRYIDVNCQSLAGIPVACHIFPSVDDNSPKPGALGILEKARFQMTCVLVVGGLILTGAGAQYRA